MQATIWGCRGSLSTPGPATVRYGGNTSCVHVEGEDGAVVVLDAGTGIRPLGAALGRPRHVELLLTHMHLDHVEGLGFFAPIFDPECSIRIWGPRPDGGSLRDRIAAYLSPPLFPLQFGEVPARIEVVEVGDESWDVAGIRVTAAFVQHRGPTLGYRLEHDDRSLAFVPDNELGRDPESGLALAAGADVLLHDAQYTAEEYRTRVGWGHSALEDLAAFLGRANPVRAVMFHHDPAHADETLEEMRNVVQELAGRPVELAAEGLHI